MQEDWDQRATEDPVLYILGTHGDNRNAFWASGIPEANELVRLFGTDKTYLDIGCGMGRLSIPLSKLVKEVYAFDVSPKMLELGADEYSAANIHWINTIAEAKDVDVAFERICFQHIPGTALKELLKEIPPILSPEGVLFGHVGTTMFDEGSHYWRDIDDGDTWTSRVYQEQELIDMFWDAGFKYDPYRVRSAVFPVHRLWVQR
jgi:SAM-dependent methyltransferase